MGTELQRYEYAVQNLMPDFLFYGHMKMIDSGSKPQPQDLVMLRSAPQGDWHLSIYVQKLGDDEHMLESLKTGALCRWSNVGFLVISRKWVSEHERLRWNDDQFRFSRIFTAEDRRAEYYVQRPYLDDFTKESVAIGVRTRFELNSARTKSDPFDWRGMSRGDLRTRLAIEVCRHKELSRRIREEARPDARP